MKMSAKEITVVETTANIISRFGFKSGDLIQEFGYDDDVDFELRDQIEAGIDSELLDEDAQEVVDAVLLWYRSDDEDLADTLMDVLTSLDESGVVWVLSPKPGRESHVDPADIKAAAPVAGLHVTSTLAAAPDWTATCMVPRRSS